MKLPLKIRIPSLGNLELVAEIELPDSLLSTAQSEYLDDAQLRERWRCSARTIARLRGSKRLPFEQPRPRLYRYRLADVEAHEAATRTEVRSVAKRRKAAS